MDVKGPLPKTESGARYVLVMQDAFSRFIDLFALQRQTTEEVLVCLKSWFGRYGIPTTFHSDNGPCFASRPFAEFCRSHHRYKTKGLATPPCHATIASDCIMDFFLRACESLLTEDIVLMSSKRYADMVGDLGKILECAKTGVLDEVGSGIVRTIQDIIESFKSMKTVAERRQKSSACFEESTFTILPLIWEQLYGLAGMTITDQLLAQSTNQKIFDDIFCSSEESLRPAVLSACSVPRELSEHEEGALRYVCGYVPFKLLKKYRSKSSRESAVFSSCLEGMRIGGSQAESSDKVDTFEAYSSSWLDKVDRGGLFRVNDDTYSFFRYLEVCVRQVLSQHLLSNVGRLEEHKQETGKRLKKTKSLRKTLAKENAAM